MELKLKREASMPTFTRGELFIDGVHFCYTVEDTVRKLVDLNKDGDFEDLNEGKVYGETAILPGTYPVVLSMSNRFKIVLPEIQNVKGFAGIRIHAGNGAIDSHGCVIIGMVQTATGVGMSKIAVQKFMEKLKDKSNITITIE